MKVKLRVESQWLELESKIMEKMKQNYEQWERETLRKAKDAADLRDLRRVFYELGDRWEFDQTTGAWLEGAKPLDTVGLILRMPGLRPKRERYVLYAVMAYSKGLTGRFDHLGDKERIIIERDTETGRIQCWSTTGHGELDVFPTDLTRYRSLTNVLTSCKLVAQPGDHALRLEVPTSTGLFNMISLRLWEIASGSRSYHTEDIDVFTAEDIENAFDFRFHRYANSVIELDRMWRHLSGGAAEWTKERVLNRIPNDVEERDKKTLRRTEGLIHVLWFEPAFSQQRAVETFHNELQSEPSPTEAQRTLIPFIGEVAYSLADITEKSKYLKWRSVVDKESFRKSEAFRDINLSSLVQEAFAAALNDILREHSLAYIGYPEKSRITSKFMRIILSSVVLPARLLSSFRASARRRLKGITIKLKERGRPRNLKESVESNSEPDSAS